MYFIFGFLSKNLTTILFLLLQFVSLFFVVSSKNTIQHHRFFAVSNIVLGKWNRAIKDFKSYGKLKKINQNLRRQNRFLLQKINQLSHSTNPKAPAHEFLSCQVLYGVYKSQHNFLLLDKGRLGGVETKMGVIGTKGVLGYVASTTNHYASVLPIIHSKMKLAIIHKPSNHFGVLYWEKKNGYKTAFVKNIPNQVVVKKGEMFLTSGFDGMFPKGIEVGVVNKVFVSYESQEQIVELSLVESFDAVKNAYVIGNPAQNEIDTLKMKIL